MVDLKTVVPNASQYGAKLAYTTYEAEQGELKSGIVESQSSSKETDRVTAREASGQAYVDLPTNASVSFIAQAEANAVTVRYTVPDGESGKVEVKVNNTVIGTLDLSSKSNWQYLDNYKYHPDGDVKVHDTPAADRLARFQFDEVSQLFKEANIKVGDKVTITNIDSTPVGIDLVDLEKAPDAIKQPENSVSITDFGAVANDGSDDYQAFMAAIESAKASKKSVYIPEGQFDFSEQLHIYAPEGVKISGAGQWHTKLHFTSTKIGGGGIVFEHGTNKIDFGNVSMDSDLTSRYNEGANYKGISGTLGHGSSIHDIKIEHFEVGAWIGDYVPASDMHYTNGLTISNATIRNNLADGVNFAQGTSNSTVINSNIRGNGDDGLATWSSIHENTNAHVAENNRFLNNTVELGWRAAGIGIFGGKGHEVANNLIKDNANWGGVRLNTVFKNSHNFDFNDTGISVHDNLLVNNGTNADTYGRVKGSIDLEEGRDYATPEKDILGELKNIKIENNTIVNNLSDQEITKTRNPKEGNIPESVNETTLTIENNHSLSVAENNSAKNVAEVDDHSLTQASLHLGENNIITITDSSHALVSGGDGNDRIRGGLGNDTINGDSGNDIIFGYDGVDVLMAVLVMILCMEAMATIPYGAKVAMTV